MDNNGLYTASKFKYRSSTTQTPESKNVKEVAKFQEPGEDGQLDGLNRGRKGAKKIFEAVVIAVELIATDYVWFAKLRTPAKQGKSCRVAEVKKSSLRFLQRNDRV